MQNKTKQNKTDLPSPEDKWGSDKLEDWDWHIHTTILKLDN